MRTPRSGVFGADAQGGEAPVYECTIARGASERERHRDSDSHSGRTIIGAPQHSEQRLFLTTPSIYNPTFPGNGEPYLPDLLQSLSPQQIKARRSGPSWHHPLPQACNPNPVSAQAVRTSHPLRPRWRGQKLSYSAMATRRHRDVCAAVGGPLLPGQRIGIDVVMASRRDCSCGGSAAEARLRRRNPWVFRRSEDKLLREPIGSVPQDAPTLCTFDDCLDEDVFWGVPQKDRREAWAAYKSSCPTQPAEDPSLRLRGASKQGSVGGEVRPPAGGGEAEQNWWRRRRPGSRVGEGDRAGSPSSVEARCQLQLQHVLEVQLNGWKLESKLWAGGSKAATEESEKRPAEFAFALEINLFCDG